MAANTRTIRFGSRVINPMTRHPAVAASAAATIEELAPGRTMIGIGTGDSSVDNIGVRPAKHAELGAYVKTIRDLLQTGELDLQRRALQVDLVPRPHPDLSRSLGTEDAATRWRNRRWRRHQYGSHAGNRSRFIEQLKIGCARAGRTSRMWTCGGCRSPMSAATGKSSRRDCDDACFGRQSSVPLHRDGQAYSRASYGQGQDARRALQFRAARQAGQHQPRAIKELGLLDYLAERFSIAGTPKDCISKLEAAIGAGARQFWMSIHFDDKARFMRDWAREIMPAFRILTETAR